MQFPPTTATQHDLPGGLCAILHEDHAAPVVSAQFWIETGSQHEGHLAGSGVSHLLEHMVFKGTQTFPGNELATVVNSAGGHWNAYTSFDRTVYYIDGPSVSLPVFLDVLFDLVYRPALPVNDFETEKDVIRREIDMGEDDPDSVATKLLFQTFFQRDSRRHPVIGHQALFDRVTHGDMTRYHRERYLPSNSFVVVSGDFDARELRDNLEVRATGLPTHPVVEAARSTEPQQLGSRVARRPFAVPTSHTTLAWQTPGLDHPDAPALELLSAVIGGGRSSRLYQTLHEERGLVHHVGSWFWSPPESPGMISVSAEVDLENRDTAESAVLDELAKLSRNGLDGEIEKARRMISAEQFKSLSTASGRASDLASNWHEARHLDFTRLYLQQLQAVTTDDLRRVADRYLREEGLTLTSLDPEHAPAPPARSPAATRSPGEVISHRLSNGLTLVLRADPRVPTIYAQAAFRTGLPAESPATAGINTIHAALLTKGTTRRSATEIAVAVESLGASLRAGAGNNTSIISAFCLRDDLPAILELTEDVLVNPAFREEALERQREVQLADLREAQEDPVKTAFRLMRARLFGDRHYGLPRLGTADSLGGLDRDALGAHHRRFFHAGNGVLALFGDLDPAEAIASCEERLAGLPAGEAVPEADCAAEGTGEVEARLDKQQAVLAIGFPGATVDSPDVPALEMLHDYCANMAGPLFMRIREELGLAYFVNATQFHGQGTGLFAFYLGTSAAQVELARRELLIEIERLAMGGIPEEFFEATRTSVLSADALEGQSNRTMAQTCALDTLFGLGPHHHLDAAKRIRALTPGEVRETAAKYFGRREPVIATVLPAD
ncbi:MAG: insulinase family protein [Akkermansiaceae bacterium]|nr:insulinase family protein [Akkermansiaceae bacterium]